MDILFSREQNLKNYNKLRKIITRTRRGLILCQALPPERNKVLKSFSGEQDKNIYHLDLTSPPLDPMAMQQKIEKAFGERNYKTFFIYNIEDAIYRLDISPREYFSRLNVTRDFYNKYDALFVFCMTGSSVNELIHNAFDFYDWFKTTVIFEQEEFLPINDVLLSIAKATYESDPGEKIGYLTEQLKQYQDDPGQLLIICVSLAKLYIQVKEYNKALYQCEKALGLADRVEGKEKIESIIYSSLGLVYGGKKEYEKALFYYKKVHKLLRYTKQFEVKIQICCNIGDIYLETKTYNEARSYYRKALELSKKIKKQDTTGEIYRRLGMLYWQKHKFKNAEKYYTRALEIFEKLGEQKKIGLLNFFLGSLYLNKKNPAKTIHFFTTALKVFEKLGEQENKGLIYSTLATYHLQSGEVDLAEEYFLKALEVLKKNTFREVIAVNNMKLGILYFLKEDYNNSLKYALKAYILLKELERPEIKSTMLQIKKLKEYFEPEIFESALREKGITLSELEDPGKNGS